MLKPLKLQRERERERVKFSQKGFICGVKIALTITIKSKEKNKIQKRIYAQNKRQREKQEKQEYQKLLVQINRDNEYLSTKKKENDLQFANWNRSAYEYDKDSSDLVLKDNLNTGFNVAKKVSNIVNPNTIKSNKIYV